jgi:TRAP-type C4-dicarboxylate transport system permease small subunit
MRTPEEKLRRRQIVLGWTFVGSSIVFILSIPLAIYLSYFYDTTSGIARPASAATTGFLPLLALLVSLASLIGFVLTSVLSLRREARDVQTYRLDLEKKTLEIEELRIDLEKARRESGSSQS